MGLRKRLPALLVSAALILMAGCGTKPSSAPAPSTPPASNATTPGSSASAPAKAPAPAGPKAGGTLRYAVLRDPAALDPHIDAGISSSYLQGNVYDSLIEYDEKGRLVGSLAESWEQPDDKTYVFKLRKGVKFHSGADFTSADVIANLKRIKDPKSAATRRSTAESIVTMEAADSHTVKLVLKAPDATFLHALASPTMYMASEKDIAAGMNFKTTMNGTGPFKLSSFEPQRRYVLAKNANYWRQGQPYLNEIVITPISDEKARINALRSGEVDLAEYIPWQEMDALSKDFNVYRHSSVFNLVRLNTAKPPLDNKKLRQALNYVVDRQEVNAIAFGGMGMPIDGPLQPPGSAFHFTELAGHFKKDWDKAKALLKEAGFNSPADVPAFEMSTTGNAVLNDTAQVVQRQMNAFGLKVSIKVIDSATLVKNRTEGTYVWQGDGQSMAWPDPDFLRNFMHSVDGKAHAVGAKFKNAQLDDLLRKGVQLKDEAERKKIYLEAEKIILDEAPWVFLLWRPQAEAAAKHVKGYVNVGAGLGRVNVSRFEHVWLDK